MTTYNIHIIDLEYIRYPRARSQSSTIVDTIVATKTTHRRHIARRTRKPLATALSSRNLEPQAQGCQGIGDRFSNLMRLNSATSPARAATVTLRFRRLQPTVCPRQPSLLPASLLQTLHQPLSVSLQSWVLMQCEVFPLVHCVIVSVVCLLLVFQREMNGVNNRNWRCQCRESWTLVSKPCLCMLDSQMEPE